MMPALFKYMKRTHFITGFGMILLAQLCPFLTDFLNPTPTVNYICQNMCWLVKTAKNHLAWKMSPEKLNLNFDSSSTRFWSGLKWNEIRDLSVKMNESVKRHYFLGAFSSEQDWAKRVQAIIYPLLFHTVWQLWQIFFSRIYDQ